MLNKSFLWTFFGLLPGGYLFKHSGMAKTVFQLLIQVLPPPNPSPPHQAGSPHNQLRFAPTPMSLGVTVHEIDFNVFYPMLKGTAFSPPAPIFKRRYLSNHWSDWFGIRSVRTQKKATFHLILTSGSPPFPLFLLHHCHLWFCLGRLSTTVPICKIGQRMAKGLCVWGGGRG